MANDGSYSISILDLPEPLRSQELKARGMTAEEYKAHMDGWEENERYLENEAREGRYPRVEKMHYDDVPLPVVVDK